LNQDVFTKESELQLDSFTQESEMNKDVFTQDSTMNRTEIYSKDGEMSQENSSYILDWSN
jgi:hypothetical protein